MKTIHLIHNPGAGDEAHSKPTLLRLIEGAGYECRYCSTDDGDEWKNIAPNTDFIVIAGGDGTVKETITELQSICKELNPKFPFTYQFSDLEYAKRFESEKVVSKLANIFAFLAIFISCLGLFGLATFTAEQRTKEIGVRKVLGASSSSIARLLSTTFLKPIVLAFLVAFPVAWYAMNDWLRNYAYKIDISWWMFAIAGLLTVCIALITVSYESIKAALVNPVKSLRTE